MEISRDTVRDHLKNYDFTPAFRKQMTDLILSGLGRKSKNSEGVIYSTELEPILNGHDRNRISEILDIYNITLQENNDDAGIRDNVNIYLQQMGKYKILARPKEKEICRNLDILRKNLYSKIYSTTIGIDPLIDFYSELVEKYKPNDEKPFTLDKFIRPPSGDEAITRFYSATEGQIDIQDYKAAITRMIFNLKMLIQYRTEKSILEISDLEKLAQIALEIPQKNLTNTIKDFYIASIVAIYEQARQEYQSGKKLNRRRLKILSKYQDLEERLRFTVPDEIRKHVTDQTMFDMAAHLNVEGEYYNANMSLDVLVDKGAKIKDLFKDYLENKKVLWTSNLRLVIKYARGNLNKGLSFEDLIQSGNLGLEKSIEGFEIRREVKFSTYASWWIKQTLQRAIDDQGRSVRIPSGQSGTIKKIRRHQGLLELGKKIASHRQIAYSINYEKVANRLTKNGEIADRKRIEKEIETSRGMLSENDITAAIKADVRTLSINQEYGEMEKSLLSVITSKNDSPIESCQLNYLRESIADCLTQLTFREMKILTLRYGLDNHNTYTLAEVGSIFKISRERVRQIEAVALDKLRKHASAKLKPYYEELAEI